MFIKEKHIFGLKLNIIHSEIRNKVNFFKENTLWNLIKSLLWDSTVVWVHIFRVIKIT